MKSESLLNDLAAAWTAMGFAHAHPADHAQIDEFQHKYGVRLPADLRAYVEFLNGGDSGRDGPMDRESIAFWRLDQMQPISSERRDGPCNLFVFADFLIDSHAYVIRLCDDANAPTPVYIDWGKKTELVADSFNSFLRGYLAKDQRVLYGTADTGSAT